MSDVTNSVPEASVLELKTVNQLNSYRFFVPSFQRGYRWTSKEVEDLLNDLWEFTNRPVKLKDEFYCLQPVVVKLEDELYCLQPVVVKFRGINEEEKEQYDVIDGQQRLTTIYILLAYLKRNDYTNNESFTISYDTREKSEDFLKSISGVINDENPDYYCMSNAYIVIEEWFKQKTHDQALAFLKVLEIQTKVIWYELGGELDARVNSISAFTRLNSSKIPVTTAELVKALFLKSENYKQAPEIKNSTYTITSEVLALEWDSMERMLQNDKFWFFIAGNSEIRTNRIEFILDLVAFKDDKTKFTNKTYIFFNSKLYHAGNNIAKLAELWEAVQRQARLFEDWYDDCEYYHMIGYLVAVKAKPGILDLIHEISEKSLSSSKDDFRCFLLEKIRKVNNTIISKESLKDIYMIDAHRNTIINVLLLHSVYALFKQGYYFRFDKYHLNKFDIEHINPTIESLPKDPEKQLLWLRACNDPKIKGLDVKINNFVNVPVSKKDLCFDKLKDFILKALSKKILKSTNDNSFFGSDQIGNLALLDSSTNRSIKNNLFYQKRKKIIENYEEGCFILPATFNVFLKYYSDDPETQIVWTKSDQDYYIDSIFKTIESFFPIINSKSN